MAGQCSVDRDFCGFFITNFTDENDIRILAHNGAKSFGKCEICARVDLDLVHAENFVFDRIFNGRNIYLWLIEQLDKSVQRCCFSRSSRPCHKDHTEGFF